MWSRNTLNFRGNETLVLHRADMGCYDLLVSLGKKLVSL